MLTPRTDPASAEVRFREIYALNFAGVRAFVIRRVSVPSDADDVVNDVFRVAWQKLEKVPEEPDTRRWLFAVARRTIANHERSRVRWWRLIERLSTLRNPAIEMSELETLDQPDDLPIRRAFNRLRNSEKAVLTLIAWDGLSRAEAAHVLGCSVGAFDLRLHRARLALRAALEQVEGAAAAENGPPPTDSQPAIDARTINTRPDRDVIEHQSNEVDRE